MQKLAPVVHVRKLRRDGGARKDWRSARFACQGGRCRGRQQPWWRLLRHHLFWLGSAVLVLFSFLGPDVFRRTATYNVAEMLAPPGAGYSLGADALGRDNLWELMLGGWLPILTGFGALFMWAYGQVLNLVMVIGIITVGLNLLADLLSSASDPRIRFG